MGIDQNIFKANILNVYLNFIILLINLGTC